MAYGAGSWLGGPEFRDPAAILAFMGWGFSVSSAVRAAFVALSGVLLSSLLTVPAFAVDADVATPGGKVSDVPAGRAGTVPRQEAEPTMSAAPEVVWPRGTEARVDLTGTTPTRARAVAPSGAVVDGGTKAAESAVVSVATPTSAEAARVAKKAARSGSAPAAVDVEVLDRTRIKPVGGVGLGVQLTRRDARKEPGPVRLSIDYSGFKYAHGGDFAARLRLVSMPACALTTPEAPGCSPDHRTYVEADNDVEAGTMSATVLADADPAVDPDAVAGLPGARQQVATQSAATVFALVSGSSSDEGDYRASSLNPSGSWDVSVGSGAFTYNVPFQIPNAPAGSTPKLALSYNSQSVDGRTSATNNQASWAGMGWDLEVGFIERRYKNCSQDGLPTIGDVCWDSPNSAKEIDGAAYTISLNGVTSQLVQDDQGTGAYHVQDDPGWRVQHLSGGHGSDDEYWVVSDQNGMRYYFGWGRSERDDAATNSVYTMPVVGNDVGEPCHASFPEPCTQAWRWGLDRVVDPNEVENAYFYDKQTNHYRSVANADKARSYDAGGYLTRIEYGWASQIPGAQLPAKVELKHVGRCVERMKETDPLGKEPAACPGISSNPDSYPDVPTDLMCDGTAADDNCAGMTYFPTFFTTDMLWEVKTWVRNSDTAEWDPAMQYQMKYGLPNPDGTVGKTLWLDYIQRMGYGDGPDLRLPVINFNGEWKDNQVGSALINFRRVTKVYGDLGSVVSVTYSQPDACDIAALPSQGSNTQNCFWQRWVPEGASAPKTGWFKKYVVTKVSADPGVGKGADSDGDPTMTTTYSYIGGAGWRFSGDPLVKDEDETWSDWRGYQQVKVVKGTKENATTTHHWLYRGLDGDRTTKTDSSTTRSVKVKDGFGTEWTDSAWLGGKSLQTSTGDGAGTEHQKVLSEYWAHTTATYDGLPDARFVRPSETTTFDLASTGWREHTIKDEYDATDPVSATYGLPMRTNDWGLAGVGDNRCTTYGRAYSTANFPDSDVKRWMIIQDEQRHYAADCADRAAANQDGYTVTLYDNSTSVTGNDAALTDANPTEVRAYTDATGYRSAKQEFDDAGRVTAEIDGKGNRTTTVYSPATSWPVDGVKVTGPDPDGAGPGKAMSTTTWSSRLWGVPYRVLDANGRTTRIVQDSIGRTSTVWRPTEVAAYPDGNPSAKFSYSVPTTTTADGVPDFVSGPSKVTSSTLQSGSTYTSSYTYSDGLGRVRETQAPAPSGTGRTVVSTRYDTSGNVTGTSGSFYNSSAAGSAMVLPTTADLPSYTDPIIDWAGRTVETQVLVKGVEQAQNNTRTHFLADRSTVIPAAGERRDTYTDVFGQTTKVVEYGPTGPATTSYVFNRSGQLTKITDAKGNTTAYTYNWQGDRMTAADPDAGSSRNTYDANGQIATTTDGASATLTYAYDGLNRPTTIKDGATTLSLRTYDTAPGGLGQPAATTTYSDGGAFTQSVAGYDDRGRVTGKSTTVPSTVSGLAGSYGVTYGYDAADHMTSVTYPATGSLPAETVTTAYSAQGNPTKLSSPLATYQSAIGFDNLGRLNSRAYGTSTATDAGVNRAYTFDDSTGVGALKRIETSTTRGGTTKTVQDDTYTRDFAGQINGIADALTGQSECFTYDELNRVSRGWTTADTTGCAGAAAADLSSTLDPYDTRYTYDEIGNIQSVTDVTSAGSTTKDYTYPGYNADESAYTAGQPRPHAVGKAGDDSFGYDDAGRMTSRTVSGVASDLAWNKQGRIQRITQHRTGGDHVSTYIYDPDGNPLMRTSGADKVLYVEGHEIRTTGTGAAKATRYYAAEGTTVAMRADDGTLTWVLGDGQASTQLAVALTGEVTRRRYTAFGEERTGTALPAGTDRGFLGKSEDEATGLSLLGPRLYDPALGRFLSVDPVTGPESPQTLNVYSYSRNNPVNFSDPSGLFSLGDVVDTVTGQAKTVFATTFVASVNVGGHMVGTSLKLADPVVRHLPGITAVTGTGEDPTAIGIGWEWATDTGPKHRNLDANSQFTQTLRDHYHVKETRQEIAVNLRSGKLGVSDKPIDSPHGLGGSDSLQKLFKDFTQNQSAAFLGSYHLKYKIVSVDKNDGTAVVSFEVKNDSTINSAVHTSPALGGYGDWWKDNIANPLNDVYFKEGVMSKHSQTVTWTETIRYSAPSSSSGSRFVQATVSSLPKSQQDQWEYADSHMSGPFWN